MVFFESRMGPSTLIMAIFSPTGISLRKIVTRTLIAISTAIKIVIDIQTGLVFMCFQSFHAQTYLPLFGIDLYYSDLYLGSLFMFP